MRTQVCITVDTEFDIGGAFGPEARSPIGEEAAWCTAGGRSQGLGYLLETLNRFDIPATFFVEALQVAHFGLGPMGRVVETIRGYGQDIQLHLHPVWTVFDHADWRTRAPALKGKDEFAGRSVAECAQLMQRGIDTFLDWNLPKPTVLRTGNLQYGENIYQAMREVGIPYASNIGYGVYDWNIPGMPRFSGCHDFGGVKEFPVLTFQTPRFSSRRGLKCLTLRGTSFAEITQLLWQARQQGLNQVVILTHPHEFALMHQGKLRAHELNQMRLAALCNFIVNNADHFEASSMHNMALRSETTRVAAEHAPLLQTSASLATMRLAEQEMYERFGVSDVVLTAKQHRWLRRAIAGSCLVASESVEIATLLPLL